MAGAVYSQGMKILIATALLGLGSVSAQLSKSDEALMTEIRPSASESAWQEIDWKTDLWAAREEAAKTGKPIYLWEMDGHPLGCV